MNDVETRLRDALAARADAVAHEPEAYAAVVTRRSGRRTNRLRALAATAATVTAVAGLAVVTRSARPGMPPTAPVTAAPAPAAPAPTAWMTLIDGHVAIWERGFARPPGYGVKPVGYWGRAVAAFGDSRRFIYASVHDRSCVSLLQQGTPLRKRNGMSTTDVAGGKIAGEVLALAVSPDRRRLAYLMHPADNTGACLENVAELRVRDLRTGGEQAWREPDEVRKVSFTGSELTSMSWSADGRYVLAGAAFAIVDTTAADRALRRGDSILSITDKVCQVMGRTFRGRTDEVVAYLFCPGTPYTGVHVFDGNRPVRLLIPAPSDGQYVNDDGIRFDRSGDHAFLLLSDLAGQDMVYRWDADTGLRRMDTGDDEIDDIAW